MGLLYTDKEISLLADLMSLNGLSSRGKEDWVSPWPGVAVAAVLAMAALWGWALKLDCASILLTDLEGVTGPIKPA